VRTVLDKRFVADRRFDEVPVTVENGKLVGNEPNSS
jgi:hypothetical protein